MKIIPSFEHYLFLISFAVPVFLGKTALIPAVHFNKLSTVEKILLVLLDPFRLLYHFTTLFYHSLRARELNDPCPLPL